MGSYRWVQVPDCKSRLGSLIGELHAGRRLAVVAFDSGPLHPDPEEQKVGWSVVGSTMISPSLDASVDIPEAGYDEWYILDRSPEEGWKPEIFVNYMSFTLAPVEELLREQDATWDRQGWTWLEPIQERFWAQIETLGPETYVASGDHVIVVSRRLDVLDAVVRAAQPAVTGGRGPRLRSEPRR
jgi:hypothetical protein